MEILRAPQAETQTTELSIKTRATRVKQITGTFAKYFLEQDIGAKKM